MMRKIYRWFLAILFIFALLLLVTPPSTYADGGAPNLAYIAGTSKGISTIDIGQKKVTGTFAVGGDPRTVLLSLDGRYLYVTQPALNKLSMIAAKTGEVLCSASIAGQPSLLSFDTVANILYVAGNGDSHVSAIDPTNCKVTKTFQAQGFVYGIAVANVGNSGTGTGNQLWVADSTSLTIFDATTGKQLGTVPIEGGPQYLTMPPGTTAYVTTRSGSVDAVDLQSHAVLPILMGGQFGPMDFDEITGKVYVPDRQNNQLDVLTPVSSGTTTAPHEPTHIYHMDVAPQSVAITSDGQFGFIALNNGSVA
ncbi:MAG: YncE family protein, partial [Chloroflexota bacterium]|nr:YncE family protein [Chloroflexota bacterium]